MGQTDVPTRGPSFDTSSGTSSMTVRVSFLFLEPFLSFLSKKKRKKVTKSFEIKEEF